MIGTKHTYEYVKKCFDNEFYILLSDIYINGSQKLEYCCPNGHKHSGTFYNWNSGTRCPTCFSNKYRADINYIRQCLYDEGYELLTQTYINNKQPLECVCNNGHTCTIKWAEWNYRGSRCRRCSYERMAMRQTGKGNSQWKGGIGRFPYCYDWQNKEYKNYIKERDGGVCQLTGCNKSIDLVIHHVDYIKENCNVENLITLCRGCNTKVNVKRESYTKFFRSLLCKKFGYKYLTNLH